MFIVFFNYRGALFENHKFVNNRLIRNTTDFLTKHERRVISKLPYSPYSVPCDFFLVPLRGMRHKSTEVINRHSRLIMNEWKIGLSFIMLLLAQKSILKAIIKT